MNTLKQWLLAIDRVLYALLAKQSPVLHTAWQAAAGALVAGLVTVRSTADVKALVMVVVATFLAALKAAYLKSGK